MSFATSEPNSGVLNDNEAVYSENYSHVNEWRTITFPDDGGIDDGYSGNGRMDFHIN